jgi:TatD DNase family protein
MSVLPPLDAHAHVMTTIEARELRAVRSVVFAVTREPSEWDAAAGRRDELCIWGLGCHPGVPAAIAAFDAEKLGSQITATPLIGEVGLDGGSSVPMADQRRVFREVLEVANTSSRLVSIHSVRASALVLDELDKAGGVSGAILHWWRGSASETRRAVELGCYFSLNGAEAVRPKVLDALPVDRVLTETDFPHSQRSDKCADKPGGVQTIEDALANAWDVGRYEARRQVWTNLSVLCSATRTATLMPRRIQGSLLSAR